MREMDSGGSLRQTLDLAVLIAGVSAVIFLITKAVTTGFWLDEAWILRPIYSYLHGQGWQSPVSLPGELFRGILFDVETLSSGPTILIPGLVISYLHGAINPQLLHLFILFHVVLVYFSFQLISTSPKLQPFFIYIILIALTCEINFTQFLGECPGVSWFILGISFLVSGLHNRDSNARIFAGGVCLGLSFLAKSVFVIPIMTTFLLSLGLQPSRAVSFFIQLILGLLFPILGWHFYQYFQAGSWAEYLQIQHRHFAFFTSPTMGSGITSLKTPKLIAEDFFKLLKAGPAFIAAIFFLFYGFFNIKRIHMSELNQWMGFAWLGCLEGILWWLFISNFKSLHGGALLRHSTGFICIALVPASVLIYKALQKVSEDFAMKQYVWLWKCLCVSFAILTLSLFAIHSFLYLFRHKGFGPYSAWVYQKELASWIDANGTPNRLLPIANCDPTFSKYLFDSHILYPQRILSSGLLEKVECQSDIILNLAKHGPVVVLNSNLLHLSNQPDLRLIAGSQNQQGLWAASNFNLLHLNKK